MFVCYRISDEPYGAALIDHVLVARFGADRVFRDSRSVRPGQDFAPAIRQALARCGALIAVIGPTWSTATDSAGCRRLDSPDDWVRWEIAEALRLGLSVVPVMLGGVDAVDEGDLPADICTLARHQFVRIDHAAVDRDLGWLLDRLAELIPDLGVPPLFRLSPILTRDFLPSALLRAEYGVVPFAGRKAELAELRAWCVEGTRLSARLLTGPAGQGKTRIADELRQVLPPDWVAGFVAEDTDATLANVLGGRVLLIVDYAEGRIDQLHDLAQIALHGSADCVRLLLVARSAGPWLVDLHQHESDQVSRLFRNMAEQWLPPLAKRVRDRHAEFARAVAFLAAPLGHDAHGILPPAGLVEERYDRALDIHAAALAALLDDPTAESEWRDPIARVLDHERRYWNRTTATYELPDPHQHRLNAVTAASTLFTARTRHEAQKVLAALPTFAGQARDVVDRYI